ncbi:P-loop containing nucleoside triphosphate hydrolase protein [Lactarius quietus]|nr:P-loop containing nucleoside triphosphate hydrolase protein [Lactarius quietus]
MAPWLPNKGGGTELAELVCKHFYDIERANHAQANDADLEGGELLCDTIFSLTFGALLLLSHTNLKLYRGRRYDILGSNGTGKSTLMRQLRDGKVENFPPQDQLRCLMVEHSLQGEDTSLSVIDFIASDKGLKHITRNKIQEQLREVGFDGSRQIEVVGGLSGGWKMKLELARAMLYNADLLLLDEPTNHSGWLDLSAGLQLDRASVAWLEHYLIAHTNVTCLIVSHDSRFLDNITTDIIHYEDKKVSATSVKFAFPPPGSLMSVWSNTRAILKMNNCPVFNYVTCRVGIIGLNGAGKSTLIKLLTHATHHTVRVRSWEKATRILTDEEKTLLNKDFVGKNGQRRKLEARLTQSSYHGSSKAEEVVPKIVSRFDDLEASREGAGQRDTSAHIVRNHLEDIGLDGDIAQYNEIAGLLGQKIKLVIAACLWNNPQVAKICVLDEPSNFLDREALGGLAVAIRDWAGAVALITITGPEIWNISEGRMTHKGKAAVVEDTFADLKSPRGSGANTPVRSRVQSPAASAAATPAASGTEDKGTPGVPGVKKKKMTRNQLKAQEERRRLRKLHWLQVGGAKPDDTDDE